MNMMNAAYKAKMNCPCKAIIIKTSINEIKESTFIISVLQVFSVLNCIKFWFNNHYKNPIYLMNNMNLSLSKEIYQLLYYIYSYQQPDSSNVILHFLALS